MKNLLITSVAFILMLFPFSGIAQHNHSHHDIYHRARVITGHSGINIMQQLGVPVDHGLVKENTWIESDFSETEIRQMRDAGLKVVIRIEDVSAFYSQQAAAIDPAKFRSVNRKSHCADVMMRAPEDYIPPAGWGPGSMGGFFTLDEVMDRLDSMTARYPDLVSARTPAGSLLTHQGREVWYVKISDNVASDEISEPNVLYTSLIHAREPAGMVAVLFYMEWLLENYGSNAEATYVVNNTQMYFVPVSNPDGYEINRTTNPSGGGMWRKNARDNGSTMGVDLNRNWPYQWGFDNIGSSGSAGSDVFRGPSPASEPETSNLIELALDRNFRTALNYHSYGDYLIFPWGYDVGIFTPDNNLFKRASKLMVNDNNYSWGTAFQTVGYAANGVTDDWYYGEQSTKDKTFAWSPEVGHWFWPAPIDITYFGQENVWQNLVLAWIATRYADVTLMAPDMISARRGQIEFGINGLGMDPVDVVVNVLSKTEGFDIEFEEKSFDRLSSGDRKFLSFNYEIDGDMQDGAPLNWEVQLKYNNAEFTYPGHSLMGATTGKKWTTTDQLSLSGTWTANTILLGNKWKSGFSDSYESSYMPMSESVLHLGSVDLSDVEFARLKFDARWEIERQFDYAVVEASPDGISWTPLCGHYSNPGTEWQLEFAPVYDGKSDWISESVSLDDFAGTAVQIRVRIVADEAVEFEGMDIADIRIEKIGGSVFEEDVLSAGVAYPNPASDIIYIPAANQGLLLLEVFDSSGRLMHQNSSRDNLLSVPVHNWVPGLYSWRITALSSGADAHGKFSVH